MDEVDWIGILGELAEGKEVYYKMPPKKGGYHRHHIKPQHMGGKDEDGIIYLTQEEHALAHWELWEKFHKSSDLGAAVMLGERCIDDIDMTGENNPNWKGGINKDPEHVRNRQARNYLERVVKDPDLPRKRAERLRKYRKKRKAEDPAGVREANRKYYLTVKAKDPNLARKRAEYSRKWRQKKLAEDPEFRRKEIERRRKWRQKKKAAQAGEVAKLTLT
jgi:hypothetical protein